MRHRPRASRLWTLVVTPGVGLMLGIALNKLALEIAGINIPPRDPMAFLRQLAIDRPIWNLIQLLAGGVGITAVVIFAAIQSPTPFRERLGLGVGTLPIRAYPWVFLGAVCVDGVAGAIAFQLCSPRLRPALLAPASRFDTFTVWSMDERITDLPAPQHLR